MKTFFIKLSQQELEIVLQSLSAGQYRIVAGVIDKIGNQVESQLNDAQNDKSPPQS